MSENKIRNAHCVYFEGQTGLCKAKEFVKCNPVNCKLYIIDELSTILDLQEQLKHKEQECEKLKNIINEAKNSKLDLKSFLVGEAMQNEYEQQLDQFKQTLAEIKEIAETISLPMGTGKSGNRVILAKQILQKIREVEDV